MVSSNGKTTVIWLWENRYKMNIEFKIDATGNAKLDALIQVTKREHTVWLLEDGFPTTPCETPVGCDGFLATAQYQPIMHTDDNSDNYQSNFYLLLLHFPESGYLIEEGFLMKWKDGEDFFWYNHDSIPNVVGFMQLPEVKMQSTYKTKNIGTWG